MTNDELVVNILENSNYDEISKHQTDFVKTYINKLVSDVAMYVDSSIVVENIQTVDKYTAGQELSQEQKNAIAMLNYITFLTQETNSSKNSRLYMEQAYSSLINNTYPISESHDQKS